MKSLQNPTTFFFKQAQSVTEQHTKQVDDFVAKLLDKDTCQLCKQNYDLLIRIPRIMIHCGHTFCTPCLKQFYMNRRVRCPMCLKLVKQLDKLQRLPINHTIYTYLVQKDKKICQKSNLKPIVEDAAKKLFSEFEQSQKQAHMKENPQKIDPDSGLPFCVFHPDRVQHFYCASHASAGCRVCSQIGHSKAECKVIDLYQIQDPNQLNEMINKSKVQSHLVSNQPQLESSDQQLENKNIIINQNNERKNRQKVDTIFNYQQDNNCNKNQQFEVEDDQEWNQFHQQQSKMRNVLHGIDYEDDDDQQQQ